MSDFETRTVNGHTRYTIDGCGEWSWSLYVTPAGDAAHGTVRAVKSVPYDGQIFKSNADRRNKPSKTSTYQMHPSDVLAHYVEESDTDLTEAELWNRITKAFRAEGVEPPERHKVRGSEPADFGGGESTGVQEL